MNNRIKQHSRWLWLTAVLVVVLALGWWLGTLTSGGVADNKGKSEPLYWVAPMDPNYKRDQPGKSPMGMDLIPVYEEDTQNAEDAGTVRISPAVAHNLGLRTAVVTQGPLNLEIDTVGYVSFNENLLTHLHSRVDGWIEKLAVTAVGDPVEKDQKLFELYSPELVTAQYEYLTAKATGNAALRQAAEQKLKALGVHHGQNRILQQLDKPQQALGFYADRAGYIAELNVREGMFISPMQTILSIGNLDSVWVTAEIFERQSAWVKTDQSVIMQLAAFPGEQWQGKVDYIYPVVDPKTRTLRARIVFDNPGHRLKPNMFAELTIQGSQRGATLSVPREAVIRDGRMSRVVKVVDEGRYRSVRIKTGIESGGHVEVLQGLQEGDRVVISAQFLIDSESSINADLSRIEEADKETTKSNGAAKQTMSETVWTTGTIKKLMAGHRMATIEHAPIAEWQWPAMSMDFNFADEVNLETLTEGQHIRFRLQRASKSDYRIVEVDSINNADDKAGGDHQHNHNHPGDDV